MTQKKIPSVLPYYITGLLWIAYALFFPMYQIIHFVIIAVISILCFIILKRIFPGRTIQVEETLDTGDEYLNESLAALRNAVKEIEHFSEKKSGSVIAGKAAALKTISENIYNLLKKEPDKIHLLRSFLNYYLPATLKLLDSYDDLSEQNKAGKNITDSMTKIENSMDMIMNSFQKELDGLFAGKAMDISAEIKIMEHMMTDQNILGK